MVSMLHRRTLSTMNKGLVCCPVTHTMFEKSHGMARFDSRRKRECAAGGGGDKEKGAHLCWPKLDNDLPDW